jgi:hypothetical protein
MAKARKPKNKTRNRANFAKRMKIEDHFARHKNSDLYFYVNIRGDSLNVYSSSIC